MSSIDEATPNEWNKASQATYAQDQEALEAYVDSIPDDEPTGWSSDYYELPEGAKELQDLIESKDMNFAIGNIFKACYRLGRKRGTSSLYDLKKIRWFAEREIDRVEKGNERP